jgi:hypothetical protein
LRSGTVNRMLSRVRYLAAIVASLVLAAPAMAQEPAVGAPQVITDQASDTEPAPEPGATYESDGSDIPAVDDGTPAPEPPPDASGRRGEIHVLDSTATSPSTPAAQAPAATHTATAAPQLPFTGPHAVVMALLGLALLAAGSGLLAVLRKPAQ